MTYYNPYTPYTYNTYNPMQGAPQQPQQMQPQSNGITFVQGENAVKAQYVAPGTSALFMDSEQPRFYIKTVDASGIPQPLRIFPYTELAQPQAQTLPVQSSETTEENDFSAKEKIDSIEKMVIDLKEDVKKLFSIVDKAKGGKTDGKPSV